MKTTTEQDQRYNAEVEARWKHQKQNSAANSLRFWADLMSIFSLGLLLPVAAIYRGMATLIEQNDKLISK